MKNHKNRLDDRDYGFLAYGRNLDSDTVKDVLKTIRREQRARQNLLTIADLKKE
jgi:hypothetical protein